jgi:hypothetical protein
MARYTVTILKVTYTQNGSNRSFITRSLTAQDDWDAQQKASILVGDLDHEAACRRQPTGYQLTHVKRR